MALSMRTLQIKVHQLAKEKGWWEPARSFGDQIALIHSEVSEALEEFRNGNGGVRPDQIYYSDEGKPEGIAAELADVVIRVMDMAEFYGIDLQEAIEMKHVYNLTRDYRHGGKAL